MSVTIDDFFAGCVESIHRVCTCLDLDPCIVIAGLKKPPIVVTDTGKHPVNGYMQKAYTITLREGYAHTDHGIEYGDMRIFGILRPQGSSNPKFPGDYRPDTAVIEYRRGPDEEWREWECDPANVLRYARCFSYS